MNEFREGRKVYAIYHPAEQDLDREILASDCDPGGMEVSMVPGQIGLIPWVKYKFRGRTVMVNCAELNSVVFQE